MIGGQRKRSRGTAGGSTRGDRRARPLAYRIGFLVLAAVVGGGCERKPSPESYYPLTPGAEWKYVMSGEVEAFAGWGLDREGWKRKMRTQNIDDKLVAVEAQQPRKLGRFETTPFEASSSFTRTTWSVFTAKSEEGFADIALARRKADPEEFEQPRFFLRFPLREGRGWDVRESFDFLGETIDVKGRSTITAVNETVTVPAGTFRHCVKVVTETSGSKRVQHLNGRDMAGEASFDRTQEHWYAPEVGLVKMSEKVALTPAVLGNAEQMLELSEFHRGKARP